jgi:hypothetical protein
MKERKVLSIAVTNGRPLQFAVTSPATQQNVVSNNTAKHCRVDGLLQTSLPDYTPCQHVMATSTMHKLDSPTGNLKQQPISN